MRLKRSDEWCYAVVVQYIDDTPTTGIPRPIYDFAADAPDWTTWGILVRRIRNMSPSTWLLAGFAALCLAALSGQGK